MPCTVCIALKLVYLLKLANRCDLLLSLLRNVFPAACRFSRPISHSNTQRTLLCHSHNQTKNFSVADSRSAGPTTNRSRVPTSESCAASAWMPTGRGRLFKKDSELLLLLYTYVYITRSHYVFCSQSSKKVTNTLSCPFLSAVTDSLQPAVEARSIHAWAPWLRNWRNYTSRVLWNIYKLKKRKEKKIKKSGDSELLLHCWNKEEDGSDFKLFVHTMTMGERKINLLSLLEGTKGTFWPWLQVERSGSFWRAQTLLPRQLLR